MKHGPWFASDASAWELAMEFLPRPLDASLARNDLRYHENATRLGQPFPSQAILSARWGWGRDRVRGLLAKDDWHDPARPVAREHLRAPRTPNPQVTPKSPNKSPNESAPSPQQANADNTADTHQVTPKSPNKSPNESALHARGKPEPFNHEPEPGSDSLSAEPTAGPAPTATGTEPRTEPAPPPKLEGLPPSGRGVQPQWLTAPVLEVYRAWYQHHPEARAIRADQVKTIRGAIAQGYTAAQLVAAVRYIHEAPDDLPKVRALRESGYRDVVNLLNERTRHQNVELGEAWLAGELGKPAAPDSSPEAEAQRAWAELPTIFNRPECRRGVGTWPDEVFGTRPEVQRAFRRTLLEHGGGDMSTDDFTRRRFVASFVKNYQQQRTA